VTHVGVGGALDLATVIVVVDPDKAFNRVWMNNGLWNAADPMSLSVSREGISRLELALNKQGPDVAVIAIEVTGGRVTEPERAHPGSERRTHACPGP
jgi:hypothetical protein